MKTLEEVDEILLKRLDEEDITGDKSRSPFSYWSGYRDAILEMQKEKKA